MSATRTRPHLRDHVHVGGRVFNVHNRRLYRIHALYDEDRTAQIRGRDGTRFTITYGELMRGYRLVQPF